MQTEVMDGEYQIETVNIYDPNILTANHYTGELTDNQYKMETDFEYQNTITLTANRYSAVEDDEYNTEKDDKNEEYQNTINLTANRYSTSAEDEKCKKEAVGTNGEYQTIFSRAEVEDGEYKKETDDKNEEYQNTITLTANRYSAEEPNAVRINGNVPQGKPCSEIQKTDSDEDDHSSEQGSDTEALVVIETDLGRITDEWIPDGGWGWAVVIGALIVHVYIGGFMKSSGVMYIQLQEKYEQGATATAWVFSLFTTFLLMMGPVASALCHRFSCRTVVFWGSIVSFVGLFVSAFAPNLQFLYFSYGIIGGFGRCLTYTPSLILVTHYFNKRRGIAVGLSTAGVGMGMFAFPPLIDGLFGEYGYQGAIMLLAAIGLHSFVCAALFRPLDTHKKIVKIQKLNSLVHMSRRGSLAAGQMFKELTQPPVALLTPAEQLNAKYLGSNAFSSTTEFTYVVPQPRRRSVWDEKLTQIKDVFQSPKDGRKRKPIFEFSLLKDFPFLSLCLAIMVFTMSMMSTFVFLPALAKSRGLSKRDASYLISIIGAVDSVARFTSGTVLDLKRIKKYRLLAYNVDMMLVGVVSIAMPFCHSFVEFAVMSGLYGLLVGTYVAQKSVVVVDMLGLEKMASSFGMVLAFQGIGSLVGPTISGMFRDVFGTYDEAFYFGGIGIFAGAIVLACGNISKTIKDRRVKRAAKRTDTNDTDHLP